MSTYPTYHSGQFEEKYRGKGRDNTVVIITGGQQEKGKLNIFQTSLGAEEYIHLTGTRAARFPPRRIYMGLNREGADELTRRSSDLTDDEETLRSLDKLVVIPYFLRDSNL